MYVSGNLNLIPTVHRRLPVYDIPVKPKVERKYMASRIQGLQAVNALHSLRAAQELPLPLQLQTLPPGEAYSSEHGFELAERVVGSSGWRPCAHATGRFQCRFNGSEWVEVFTDGDPGL